MSTTISSRSEYAHPEVLVDVDWSLAHLTDPKVKIAEVDYDPNANYNQAHVPGAVLIDWKKDINDPVRRDIVGRDQLEQILSRNGIANESTLLLYGDFNNWFAAFAFWVLKYYGFKDVRIINGGRKKWIEEDKPLTKEVPAYARTEVRLASNGDDSIRAYLDEVRRIAGSGKVQLVDVRSPKEFSGEILAPPEYPTEHAQRGGHIPGAVNIPWAQAVRDDGTFKSPQELASLYESKGVTGGRDTIAYCRIGERSSHTWFVLTYLLGYPNVKNYDGSWTEWGNMVRNPVEK